MRTAPRRFDGSYPPPPGPIGSGVRSRFGRTYAGEPDRIAAELAADEAVQAADTVLFTVPNQLGVAYNTQLLATIARDIAPAIGWTPAQAVPLA